MSLSLTKLLEVGSAVERVKAADQTLERYEKYIKVLQDYKFNSDESKLGQIMRYQQPESIFEMVSRAKGAVGKRGTIVWDGPFGIAEKYYGKETWEGKAPKERMVIPFLTGSSGKPFFEEKGWKKEEYQVGYVESKSLNGKKLVVADYGEDLVALMLDLMDRGFPYAPVEWKWSRAVINDGEKNDRARLGSLRRGGYGVGVDYYGDSAVADVFAGASLES